MDFTFDDLHHYLLSNNGRIIHQVWFKLSRKSKKLFASYQKMRASWRLNNPTWAYVIWTESMAKEFMTNVFPEYLDMYLSYEHPIQRIDSLRYFILYEYGGIYTDMDMIANVGWDDILQKYPKDLYLVETPNQFGDVKVSNCLMYSKPRHIFWKKVFIELEKNREMPWYYPKHLTVMYSTGPSFLNRVFMKEMYKLKLATLPYGLFNPFGVGDVCVNAKHFYTIHIGSGSWENSDSKLFIFLYCNYSILLLWFVCMLTAFLFALKRK